MLFDQLDLNFNATQKAILDGAIRCVKKNGLEKTSVNDIARVAGVSRPTVYSYFKNKDDIVTTALVKAACAYSEGLLNYLEPFDDPYERFVESFLYGLVEVPKNNYLTLITRPGMIPLTNREALLHGKGQDLATELHKAVLKNIPLSRPDLDDIMEINQRLMLSFLSMPGPVQRSPDELRAFLRKWIVPMIQSAGKPR